MSLLTVSPPHPATPDTCSLLPKVNTIVQTRVPSLVIRGAEQEKTSSQRHFLQVSFSGTSQTLGDLGEQGRPGRCPLRPAWETLGTRILAGRAAPSGPYPIRSCKARWAHLQSRAGPCPRPRSPSAAVTHHFGSLLRPTGCRAAVCFLLTSGAASGREAEPPGFTYRASLPSPRPAPPPPPRRSGPVGSTSSESSRAGAALQPIAAPVARGGAAVRSRT